MIGADMSSLLSVHDSLCSYMIGADMSSLLSVHDFLPSLFDCSMDTISSFMMTMTVSACLTRQSRLVHGHMEVVMGKTGRTVVIGGDGLKEPLICAVSTVNRLSHK